MKSLLALIALVAAMILSVAASAADRPSVHGMFMFGEKKIYLNHLAMFHAPHNYQAIFEVEVSDPAAYENLRQATENAGDIMTVVPEVFALDQMIASPRAFKGVVYAGHFERGGQLAIAEMTFTIKKVVHSHSLPAQATRVSEFTFGEGDEKYSAHRILRAPDFDRIVRLKDGKEIYLETADLQ